MSAHDVNEILRREGFLSRWLGADTLEGFCRVVFPDVSRTCGVNRLLILAERAGRPAECAFAPDDEATAVQSWFEGLPMGKATETMAQAPTPAPLPPSCLQLDSSRSIVAGPGLTFHLYWSIDEAAAAAADFAEYCTPEHPVGLAFELALTNLARLEKVRELSHIDLLTGTFNRRHFGHRIAAEVDRARRFNRPLSLLICDLDGFKKLNDEWGHQAGDVVLRYAGQTIRLAVRSIDIVCRLGGDEFAILMPDTDRQACSALAERLRGTVCAGHFPVGGKCNEVRLRASLGGAVFPEDAEDPGRLLWCADMALLAAKRSGGDRLILYDPTLRDQIGRHGAAQRIQPSPNET